ncbi:MAG: winged helix DNA-binding domain-containing protein [Nitrososphaerota archaeon]|nr:winged helix DNA-binding domain-containing protein [Nitrososphaerota archaeon]
MGKRAISATADSVRRLTVTKQRLAGERPRKATREDIVSVIRDLAYVQWDPVTIVAPSHAISLWSRIGDFRNSDLEGLLWDERRVFEHWTPIASIVLTEDYPLYSHLMKRYPESLSKSWRNHIPRAKKFLAEHRGLRKNILRELEGGPLLLNQFGDYVKTKRSSDGWSTGNDVSNMLFHLLMKGEVMVVGHAGNQNVWGLTKDFLPERVLEQDIRP